MCPLRKQTSVVHLPLQSGSDLHTERLEMKWNTAVKVPNTLGRDRVLGLDFLKVYHVPSMLLMLVYF